MRCFVNDLTIEFFNFLLFLRDEIYKLNISRNKPWDRLILLIAVRKLDSLLREKINLYPLGTTYIEEFNVKKRENILKP